MHRRPLLELLACYQEQFPDEADVVNRVRTLVQQHANCFDRDCRPGHITGSAWVVSGDRQRALLVHHRKLDRWIQPGGHADGDPDVGAVALREAMEESGLEQLEHASDLPLDIDVHIIPARYDTSAQLLEDAHEHHDIRYLIAAPGQATPVVSDESHDVRWFTLAEIEQLTGEESVLRLLRKSLAVRQ